MAKNNHDNKKPFGTKDVLLYHWRIALGFPKMVLTSFIIGPASIILDRYIAPLIIAAVFMKIQDGTVTMSSSWWLLVAYIGIAVIAQVIGYRINLYAMWDVQIKGARKVYQQSYQHLTRQSMEFFNNRFAGSLVSQVNRLAAAYYYFWNTVIFEVMFVSVVAIGTIIGTAILMWQLSVVLTLLVILYIVASYYATKFMRSRQKARSKAYTKLSAQISDSVSNMFAVKIDGKEPFETSRMNESLENVIHKEKRVRSGIIFTSTAFSSIAVLMRVAALAVSIIAIENNIANVGVIYLMLTYTFNLIEEARNITSTFRSIYQITGDSEEMLETLAEPISIQDNGKLKLNNKDRSIEFKNIDFRHENSRDILFKDFNLSVKPGEKVGLVGASGAGKTTVTKLLMRFVEPTSGSVNIGGKDLKEISQDSLHNHIAYVPQEPLLFHRSISENIGYSKPEATQDQIVEAARKAHIHEFIEQLPDGYDTLVGERGVKLSGGQRQRIAIARAILKDAPILVLDEATSALDSESEKLIQKSFNSLMKDRTSMVIAHRLSTIAKLDRIVVLDDGKIIEDGTHDELLKANKTYARLWKHQSGGFIEE